MELYPWRLTHRAKRRYKGRLSPAVLGRAIGFTVKKRDTDYTDFHRFISILKSCAALRPLFSIALGQAVFITEEYTEVNSDFLSLGLVDVVGSSRRWRVASGGSPDVGF